MTELERSDFFWEMVSDFGAYGFMYDSLADITNDSHVVVVGRVIDVRQGEIQPFAAPQEFSSGRPTLFGIVAIDKVLKGEPYSATPGTVRVARLGWELSADELPAGEVVLFLKNYAQMREEEGVAPSSDADDRFYYARPNGYQCVLRNLGGKVRIVDGPKGWEEALGPFPSHLDGRSFNEVVDRVRELAAAM